MLKRLPSHLIPNFLQMDVKHKKKRKRNVQKVHVATSCKNMLIRPIRNWREKENAIRPQYQKRRKKKGQIDEISKVIRKVMLHFDLPASVINHIIEKMNLILKTHVNKAIAKLSKNYTQEKCILQAEYDNKESEFKKKLEEVDKFLNDESKKIEKEHKKLVFLTENMVFNEKKLSEKSKEMEIRLKKVNELEVRLAQELQHCSRNKASTPAPTPEACTLKHCDKQCEEYRKEIEELKVKKNGFEKIAENQNVVIANLTAKSNIMYKQLQEGMYTIEELKGQLALQRKLLENEKRRNREQTSERTISSSDALTVGTDGEGDHNVEDVIKQSHLKLEQLEKESEEIERKFKEFQLTLRNS